MSFYGFTYSLLFRKSTNSIGIRFRMSYFRTSVFRITMSSFQSSGLFISFVSHYKNISGQAEFIESRLPSELDLLVPICVIAAFPSLFAMFHSLSIYIFLSVPFSQYFLFIYLSFVLSLIGIPIFNTASSPSLKVSDRPSVHLAVHLSARLSVYAPLCPSICGLLATCRPCICPSSPFFPVYLSPRSYCLSVCEPPCVSVCLRVTFESIHQPACLGVSYSGWYECIRLSFCSCVQLDWLNKPTNQLIRRRHKCWRSIRWDPRGTG